MAKGLFTALFNALSDPKSYYAMQKEMNMKAVAETFFNTLAGKTVFEAVALPEDIGEAVIFDGRRAVRVRPLGIYDLIIPEPCEFKDLETRKRILSLHPIAYPDSGEGATITEADQNPFEGVRIIECFFKDGPQSSGRLRGLTYRKKTIRGFSGASADYKCLFGENIRPGARSAFAGGGYVPNAADQGPPTPGTIDKRMESKYSLPPTGKKVLEPKHIVIHYGTGNNVLSEQSYGASKNPTPAGYHYGVRRSGEIYYFNDDRKRIIHASNYYFNNNSVAMNFENYGYARDDVPAQEDWIKGRNPYGGSEKMWQPYTDEQYEKGADLIAKVCKKFNLDPAGTNADGYPTIVGHDFVTAKVPMNSKEKRPLNKVDPSRSKSDPGPAFDYDRIRKLAKSKISTTK